MNFKDMITVKELAKKLGVDPDTIRHWADQGKIRCYRNPCNNYRYFSLEEVLKTLDFKEKDSISSSDLKPEI